MTKDAPVTTLNSYSNAYYVATTIILVAAICGLSYCGTTPSAAERKEMSRRDFILECVRITKAEECEKLAGPQ